MISVDDKSHMQCQYSHGLLPTFRIGGNANFQLEVRKKLMCACLCVHVCESVCVCVCVCIQASLVAQMVKNLPAMQETCWEGWEDPLEEGMDIYIFPSKFTDSLNPPPGILQAASAPWASS